MEGSVLLDIADEFPSIVKCRKLAAKLGVAKTFIDEQIVSGQGTADVTYSVMAEWQRLKGGGATSLALYKALGTIGCEGLAQRFESVLFREGEG